MVVGRQQRMESLAAQYDPLRPVVEAIVAGDSCAMGDLIRTESRWVRGVVYGVLGRADEVDDCVQRVWLTVWREAHGLQDLDRWRHWLYRIARHAALDLVRAKRRRRKLLEGFRLLKVGRWRPAEAVPGPAQEAVADERQDEVLAAIETLPPLYREPFVLKHLEGWSCRQIGEVLGLPEGSVETRLVRARRLLRERLKPRSDE